MFINYCYKQWSNFPWIKKNKVNVKKTECTEYTEYTESGDFEPWTYVLVTPPVMKKIMLPPLITVIKNYACTETIQRHTQIMVTEGVLLTEVFIRNQYRHFFLEVLTIFFCPD